MVPVCAADTGRLRLVNRPMLGRMHNPVRGFLHGTAALASTVALFVLVVRTRWDTPRMVSMVVFGVSAVALYTTSSLYHSVPWKDRWKARMQRLDHSMIFLLIAGTYTPIAFNVLEGSMRWATLGIVWGAALGGILQKTLFPSVRNWLGITLSMLMGWFAVIPLPRLIGLLGAPAVGLLLLGGIFYTAGMILLVLRRPRFLPGVFSYHEVFHLLVVSGTISHFLMILWYVAPFARS
jgi:hemolysin III